jgi:hypothetical protein
VPHVPQKRWPGGFVAPQLVQPDDSAEPQSPQNFWSALADAPHAGQLMSLTARS